MPACPCLGEEVLDKNKTALQILIHNQLCTFTEPETTKNKSMAYPPVRQLVDPITQGQDVMLAQEQLV